VSAYLVRNCYTVCACFRTGASTFQVLARHDSARAYFFPARTRFNTARARYDTVRARLYSARTHLYSAHARLYSARACLYFARARLYSTRARLHSVRARLHSACARLHSTPVPNFQSTSHLRPHLPHRHPRPSNIYKRTRKYRPHPWLCVCARRSTVRVLEHPIRVGINAFAPEDSRETTAACARGTISLRPFAMHSPCTWACNCISSCLLGTSWIRTKADFI
jgi:hypothetical protein